ncbi:hypothetical protein PRIPAC_74004 [Pristionchus pacificus]|uniref:Uncharacterized protein n=1 Tax=Pristionchus pacificus TaxID=54126 RepID=A0A2A6CG79_PRIPA|nr:hypothetical protein PRIPAC_74004 [Pristionchus pacificus]|eukprot:PDM77100.1 hypothetical protein PRIPAC_43012 [Pristionchus pacificus]
MNGPYQSVYGVDTDSIPQYQVRVPSPVAVPPKAAPRSTVTRPVTVGALREARAAPSTTQRVPITQRVKERQFYMIEIYLEQVTSEVPARNKLKKKTVAFGVTTNVSQTVEKEKDPHPIDRPSLPFSRPIVPSRIPPSTTRMSLGRVGVAGDRTTYGAATTRPLTTAARQPAAAAAAVVAPPPVGDENRPPTRAESMAEERKDTIGRLEARMIELEKREIQQGEKHKELQIQFDRLVKIVTTLTEKVAELEVDKGRGEIRERRSDDDENSRSRRRLYSSEDNERGRGGEGRREQRQGRERGGERRDERELLANNDYLRALERQLATNPVLRRTIDDAIEQDEYEREYGGDEYGRGGRRTTSPPMIRVGVYDEYDDPPRATNGRLPASAPPTNRWKEERRSRPRMTPPGVVGGGREMGGRMDRKRSDITPSRRRVTERVTMTRVHHFDESSDSDGRGYAARYDIDDPPQPYPRTQYSEEIIDDIHSAVVPQNNARRGYGQPTRRNQQHHEGAPVITEVSDTEDDRDRKRRLLRERMEAREGRK